MAENKSLRPKNVDLALKILWGVLIVNLLVSLLVYGLNASAIQEFFKDEILRAAPEIRSELIDGGIAFAWAIVVVGHVVGSGLAILFYIMAGKGKNWARICVAVLFGISVVGMLYSGFKFTPSWQAILNLTSILGLIAQGVAIGLLFSAPANEWYQPKRFKDSGDESV